MSLYRKINIKETRQANNFYLILRSNNTLNIKKKIGACVFWAPVFFLSLLAGKLEYFEQPILTEHINFSHKKRGNVV